jgi:hypothetical protein
MGGSNQEGVFWILPNSVTGFYFTPVQFTNETMRATVNLVPGAVGMVHTHPNAAALPEAGDHDSDKARPRPNGIGMPIYVLTNRGLFVHRPGETGPDKLIDGTAWRPKKQ